MKLQCIECGAIYPATLPRYLCDCGGALDVVHDLPSVATRVSRQLFDGRLGSQEFPYKSGVWRYAELVAAIEPKFIISKPEGNTNLYRSEKLSSWVGLEGLVAKHEGENPTGSFKDRGMTVGISHAKLCGVSHVVCASTGNTAASMASYAATGDLKALILVPEAYIAYGKLSQSLAYGATTLAIRGDFDSAMAIVRHLTKEPDVYILNSINPFRIEGQKSIVFEMLQQLRWSVPDWIALPGGNLANAAAFGKALSELRELKLISRLPRLAVIQAAGANPFYQAYRDGFPELRPVVAKTIASAIRIGSPVSYKKAVRAIKMTDGVVEEATDQEIMDAKAQIDGAGIGCEPASAASVAGVKKLVEKGIINKGDLVVAILTGHLLKDPDATVNYHLRKLPEIDGQYANPPVAMDPVLEKVLAYLEKMGFSRS